MWLALLPFWLSLPPALPYDPPLPSWWNGGRVYTSATLHVGIRPAGANEGAGLTVQITAE